MEKLNTHYYDGKWIEEKNRVFKLDGPIDNIDIEIIKNEIREFLSGCKATQALKMLEKIGATDSANQITSGELLHRVWRKVKNNPEANQLFIEQLADIASGSCPQGQTTRLFQVLKSFYD